jgi:hypothetical protein
VVQHVGGSLGGEEAGFGFGLFASRPDRLVRCECMTGRGEVVGARGGGAGTVVGAKRVVVRGVGDARRFADGVFGLSLAGLLGYAWFLGRGFTFFLDDWNLVVDPAGHLLVPHFGHLSLVPKVLYRLLLVVFGLHSYGPFRLMGCVAFAVLGVSLYLYLRARLSSWLACFVAVGFIWFSQSDLFPPLFAVLVNYTIPLAATIGIWALLDRRSWRADWFASALLGLALASSAVGLMAAIAVAAEFLVARAPWRRWLRFAPPVLVWLVWYVKYHQALAPIGSAKDVLVFTLREFNDTVAAVAGGSLLAGWLLVSMVAVGLIVAVRQRVRPHATSRRFGDLMPVIQTPTFTPRAAGALTAAIGFAVATAITRRTIFGAQNANVGRYLWVIAFFLVIAFTECFPLARLGPLLALLAGVLLIVNGVVLADNLDNQRADRLDYQGIIQPLQAATQAVGTHGNRIIPISIVPIRASQYLTAVSKYGAPPGTTGRPAGSEHGKLQADQRMIADLDIAARSAGYLPAVCRALNVSRPETVIRSGTLLFLRTAQSPVSVKLRRYAATYSNPAIAVLASQTLNFVSLPRDHSSVPWTFQFTPNTVTAYTCPSVP